MFATFRTAIKAILDARKGSGQPLVEVYDYHATQFAGYPSATFEPSDIVSDFETNVQNLRQYVFRITIHQEIEAKGRSAAIATVIGIVDTLIDDFDKSESLDGEADFVHAVPMEMGFYGNEKKQTMYAELKIVCVKSVYVI